MTEAQQVQEAGLFQCLKRRPPAGTAALILLLAGFLLRNFFMRRHAFLAGDSFLYQEIASNWLHGGIYGLSTDTAPRPTFIRLPGYPAVLAVFAFLFDRWLRADLGTLRSFVPVFWFQNFVDLGTCWLASRIAFRLFGLRAALAALALGCLCPFTANYTAVPLTETLVLFLLALAFDSLQKWLRTPSAATLGLLAFALSGSTLLRPDQGLLFAAVIPVMLFGRQRIGIGQRSISLLICLALAALPFIPWTVRNYRTFHVFQPLAPRLANDPGEVPPVGFQHWYRTWAVDFSSTLDAYWKYPEDAVSIGDLPERAFDSNAERHHVQELLAKAANEGRLDAAVDQQFRQLAAERTRAHPFRTLVVLPVARLVDMLLRPRTEMLPSPERWWQYRVHPRPTLLALAYALLNLLYLAAGLAGAGAVFRANRSLALAMLLFVALRCALLLTLDNAEQRYTLEFFPILFVFASSLALRGYRRSFDAIQNC